MLVATLECAVIFYATSLKEKRGIVRRTLSRCRSTFPVSASEVDEQDNPGGAVLGFAIVGSDARHLESTVQKLLHFIDELELVEIVDVQRRMLRP
jgi:uncharacterized protein YlxP (DUF503 family)